MITGRGVEAAIASMTSRVKAPCTVEEPSRMVGAAILMASSSPTRSPARNTQLRAVLGVGLLEVAQIVHVVKQQAWPVDRPDPGVGLLDGGALGHHGVADLIGDTQPGRPRAEHNHLLVAHRDAGDPHRRVQRGHHHRAGALHVVVEHAVIRAIVSRMARAFCGPKSSKCNIAWGNNRSAV